MLRQSVLFLACFVASSVLVSCTGDLVLRKKQAETSRQIGEGYLTEGNVTAALGELLKAEKLYDKDHFLHYDLGLAYSQKRAYESAIEHLEKAVELRPDYSEAFNVMGLVYLTLQRQDRAIWCFNQARNNLLYATPHYPLSNLGEAYREKKDYDRAIHFYKKALEIQPRFVNAHRGMGLTYIDMGNYEAAVGSLERAVRYAPRFADAHFELGRAYVKLYKRQKAISAFKKVVELAPDSPLAETALAEISKLQE